jgi:cytochrome c peroxidase
MKTIKVLFLFSLTCFVLSSCIKDQVDEVVQNYTDDEYAALTKALDLPMETHEYRLDLPAVLGGTSVMSDKHQATLGRVLFYDKRLSANDEISCASCHKAELAFSDDVAFSEGFNGELTPRNSLTLGAFPSFNAYYGFSSNTRMFWDERAANVVEQSEVTLQDPIEMGEDLNNLADELLKEEYYRILFAKAFPENGNNFFGNLDNKQKILRALEAFVNSIGCFNSRFDQGFEKHGVMDVPFSNFTAEENAGKQLFNANCASCHNLGGGFATTVLHANNGLDALYEDKGIGGVTNQSEMDGVFKVPMLRNIAVTGPFMHDGRFETLEEVVEHYSTGIKNHPNLHENLRKPNGLAKHLNLTDTEKENLVAFLHTLTDLSSMTQEKYADPFVQ